MDNNYYTFDSKGSLVTLGVEAVQHKKAISENDWTEKGGRYITQHLIRGEHNDYISFPVEFIVHDGKKIRDVIEIRERLKVIFEDAGLTGWRTYDVIIRISFAPNIFIGLQCVHKKSLMCFAYTRLKILK